MKQQLQVHLLNYFPDNFNYFVDLLSTEFDETIAMTESITEDNANDYEGSGSGKESTTTAKSGMTEGSVHNLITEETISPGLPVPY